MILPKGLSPSPLAGNRHLQLSLPVTRDPAHPIPIPGRASLPASPAAGLDPDHGPATNQEWLTGRCARTDMTRPKLTSKDTAEVPP